MDTTQTGPDPANTDPDVSAMRKNVRRVWEQLADSSDQQSETVTELAARLLVSPGTVRRALAELQDMGLAVSEGGTRSGSGRGGADLWRRSGAHYLWRRA